MMTKETEETVALQERKKPEETAEKPAAPAKRRPGRVRRILCWTLGVLAVLLVAALLLRDVLIEHAVRHIGSMATGTPVEIASFRSSLFSGRVEIAGFKVGNPEGYLGDAIVLEKVVVQLQPLSLLSEKIVVDEINIQGMEVDFEVTLTGNCNLLDIQHNIEAFAGLDKAEKGKDAKPKPEEESSAAQKQVVIRLFKVSGTKVNVSSALLNTVVSMPLPGVELTDVGDGKPFGETLNTLFLELLASIANGGSALGINSANFKALGDAFGQAGDSAIKAISDGGGAIGDGVKDGIDSVRRMFGK